MNHVLKIPLVLRRARLLGAVATLCVVFFMASGCNDEKLYGKKIVTPNGAEIWLRGCKCKEGLYCKDPMYKPYDGGRGTFLDEWLHIAFYIDVKDDEIVDFINETGLFKPLNMRLGSRFLGLPEGDFRNYARVYVQTKERKTCMQLKEIISMLEESPIVAFAFFAFWWEYGGGQMVSLSPYFYVNVDHIFDEIRDYSDVYAVAQETNTTIMRLPMSVSGGTFILRANKNSKGNSLQMAVYFAKTGKFRQVYAQWYHTLDIRTCH